MKSTLAQAAKVMQGTMYGADRAFAGVSTDTRLLRKNELFFALSGPNFDGREFISQAGERGAAGAVVAKWMDDPVAQIEVDDTRLALGRLGRAWRSQYSPTVVGVTGSNGKTTLKEMIAACLERSATTLATAGNLNNDIGLPLMLLRIDESHRFVVLEMGANHGGEIAYLTSLACPDVVVITNAGPSHLEGFKDLPGVAKGKGEILQGEPRPNHAVLNADDDYFSYWSSLVGDVPVSTFGLSDTADVFATNIEPGRQGSRFSLHLAGSSVTVDLPLPGAHNVRNACAAAAVAAALDMTAAEIAAALSAVQPVGGRLQALDGLRGAKVYDDSYNANPASVRAAGAFLAGLDGDNWMVLGDMGELGENARAMHGEVGAALREAGVDRLFAVGPLGRATVAAFGDHGEWFDDIDALIDAVKSGLGDGVNVLVKGSRSARMERVVTSIRASGAIRTEP